jgi:hypothetical protein
MTTETSTTNAPESQGLTEEENEIFEEARAAGKSLAGEPFERWKVIGRGVMVARAKADAAGKAKLSGKRDVFRSILDQQDLLPYFGQAWQTQKATANKLQKIMEKLEEVEAWRSTLSTHERIQWAAPSTIYKHCPLFKAAGAGDGGLTDPTPGRKIKARRISAEDLFAAHGRISELEAELKELKTKSAKKAVRSGIARLAEEDAASVFPETVTLPETEEGLLTGVRAFYPLAENILIWPSGDRAEALRKTMFDTLGEIREMLEDGEKEAPAAEKKPAKKRPGHRFACP